MEKSSFRKLMTPLVSNIFSETVLKTNHYSLRLSLSSLTLPVKEPQLLVVWPWAGNNYSVMQNLFCIKFIHCSAYSVPDTVLGWGIHL